VKINPLVEATRFINRVQKRQDDNGKKDKNQQEGQSFKENLEKENQVQVDSEEVKQAIEEFARDPMAKRNGFVARAENTKVGLKIVLKDGTGKVIRQFTGQEFLEMRDAVKRDGEGSGKILDQKL